MRHAIFLLAFVAIAHSVLAADKPQRVPATELGSKYELIGKLGEPLGTIVKVEGLIVEGPKKGPGGGFNLRVRRINGNVTQEVIQLPLRPHTYNFGEDLGGRDSIVLPKPKYGETFRFEGYESGQFTGHPDGSDAKAGHGAFQSTGFHFRMEFRACNGKKLDPIADFNAFTPADFVDRTALLQGIAKSIDKKAMIVGEKWTLVTDADSPWPKNIEGKSVEGLGTVRKSRSNEFSLEKGKTRLAKLEDQLDREVELRGTIQGRNGHLWFDYRGTKLYVEGLDRLLEKIPDPIGASFLITGKLEEADLPHLDRVGIDAEPSKRKYFIVRQAAVNPTSDLLAPERTER